MYKKLIVAIALVIGFPGLSQAALLNAPGPLFTDYALSGTTAAAKPSLAGLIIEDVTTAFSITGAGENLSGQIQNRVVRSVDGTLDFYWRIQPDAGSGDISAFRLGGFEGTTLDADFRPDGLGNIGPTTARYFGNGSGKVNFLFDPEVGTDVAGGFNTSLFFYLDTAALFYDMSGQFDLLCAPDNCISQLYSTFAPSTSPVPVPAAIWLFGSALIGLVGFGKRRKAA